MVPPDKPLADIVIGVARHFDLQARCGKGTKALPGRAGQLHGQVIGLKRIAHAEIACTIWLETRVPTVRCVFCTA